MKEKWGGRWGEMEEGLEMRDERQGGRDEGEGMREEW